MKTIALAVGLAAAAAFAEEPDAGVPSFSLAPGKGVTVQSADGAYSANLKGRLQLRDTVVLGTNPSNELAIRTVRFTLSGTVFSKDLKYYFLVALGPADFEAGNPSPIFDAYVESTHLRDLNVRLGQFFVPFDRARTIREFALQFVDRQQVVGELNLDRDIGLMISSQDLFGLGGRLNYAVGFFGGSGKNRFAAEVPGFLYTARVGLKPFGPFDDDVEGDLERKANPRLALGAAFALNHNATRARSNTGATYTLGPFQQLHGAADLVFKWHGVSLLAEFLVRGPTEQFHEVDSGTAVTREWARAAVGYTVQVGVMLGSKWVELAARWNDLYPLSPTDPALETQTRQFGREVSAAVNVYLNGHALKVQTDWNMRFGDGSQHFHNQLRLVVDGTF